MVDTFNRMPTEYNKMTISSVTVIAQLSPEKHDDVRCRDIGVSFFPQMWVNLFHTKSKHTQSSV